MVRSTEEARQDVRDDPTLTAAGKKLIDSYLRAIQRSAPKLTSDLPPDNYFVGDDYSVQDERRGRAAIAGNPPGKLVLAGTQYFTSPKIVLQEDDREQMKRFLYLHLFWYGRPVLEEAWYTTDAAEADDQHSVSRLLVRADQETAEGTCLERLENRVGKLVEDSRGLERWRRTTQPERLEYFGRCFDEAPCAVSRWIFAPLEPASDIRRMALYDDLPDWKAFIRWRFCI